ncbi:uncharacterized protein B0I36DRAFT_415956 [Microdochium trichocladiopsis]|uniref:Uncharacterized protein n=1 Tax=Microdochium trichocladiopsis TaxID=1682393 RepID=A0A9P9BL52_9PEZI|nr:uncharacterized protein B0I36DRAFT_415956 [Microdochium trichocladiopsis]KAH7024534.1 hypothetical protein B0I36DRAFT_415956 [Microdochium trichocladiopsis]
MLLNTMPFCGWLIVLLTLLVNPLSAKSCNGVGAIIAAAVSPLLEAQSFCSRNFPLATLTVVSQAKISTQTSTVATTTITVPSTTTSTSTFLTTSTQVTTTTTTTVVTVTVGTYTATSPTNTNPVHHHASPSCPRHHSIDNNQFHNNVNHSDDKPDNYHDHLNNDLDQYGSNLDGYSGNPNKTLTTLALFYTADRVPCNPYGNDCSPNCRCDPIDDQGTSNYCVSIQDFDAKTSPFPNVNCAYLCTSDQDCAPGYICDHDIGIVGYCSKPGTQHYCIQAYGCTSTQLMQVNSRRARDLRLAAFGNAGTLAPRARKVQAARAKWHGLD